MKWLKLLSLSGVAVVSLVAVAAGPASAAGELHLYNWGDYINPEVIDRLGKSSVKVSWIPIHNEECSQKFSGCHRLRPGWHHAHARYYAAVGLLEETHINQSKALRHRCGRLALKQDPKAIMLPYHGPWGIFITRGSWSDINLGRILDFAAKNPGKITLLDDLRETSALV